MFGWQQYFPVQEIYPGDKTAHFRRSLVFCLSISASVCWLIYIIYIIAVVLWSWHEVSSNTSSVRSPVMDEEMMRPGHWLELVLCVSFHALTLMVFWREGQI